MNAQLTQRQRDILIHAMVRMHIFHRGEDQLKFCSGIGTPPDVEVGGFQ